jgi:hypothetical protein
MAPCPGLLESPCLSRLNVEETMQVFVEQLAQVVESHAEEIAAQWAKAVRRNPKTHSFHKLSEEHCTLCAKAFYRNFVKVYFEERPYANLEEFFSQYAEARFKDGIPLKEAIHSLLMLRRQMWLFADLQTLFTSTTDQYQAVETLNQTIRIFDQGVYLIIDRYQELSSGKG